MTDKDYSFLLYFHFTRRINYTVGITKVGMSIDRCCFLEVILHAAKPGWVTVLIIRWFV